MFRFRDIRMKPKLVFLFMMTGAFPLLFIGWLGVRLTSESFTEQALEQLLTVQEIKAAQVGDFFQEREDGLRMLADGAQVREALLSMEEHKIGASGSSEHAAEARIFLALRNMYRPYFTKFIQTFGYHDVLLVSPSGQILFSVASDSAPGTMLTTGELSDSNLAMLWKSVSTTRKLSFADFEPFQPSFGLESAFMGLPVQDTDGTFLGMAAVQYSPDTFQNLMRTRQGLGETGESYLVGYDALKKVYEFRSSMVTMGKGDYVIGHAFPPTGYWKDAFHSGNPSGAGLYIDSAGKPVLAAFTRIRVHDLNWALISKVDRAEVIAPANDMLSKLVLGGFLVLCMVAVGSYTFTRGLIRPIEQDVEFAQQIADGDLEARLDLDQQDELGRLARTLNRMAASLRNIDWMARGKEGLDNTLRGEHDVADLARRFITFFAEHLDAKVGAVYLRPEGTDNLDLLAGYAFTDRKGNLSRFSIGEGLVGQAALERQTIVFSDIEEGDAPSIDSGLEERVPPHTLVAPVVHEDETLGVVLLGSLTPFSAQQRELVEQNLENLAIHLKTSRSREVIQELLDQAQEQAEALKAQRENLAKANEDLESQATALKQSEAEMQAQQEELRVTNEELEEQTKALKVSEEKLQSQQEELRVTNEELEERTKALEKQRTALRQKNIDLLRAQDLIEQKAKDLEIASKYKSEFLANMSHELRTPLNSILILSQLLADNAGGNLTDKQVESARAVNSSGSDLLTLINEILDLSKVESGKVEVEAEMLPLPRVMEDLKRVFAEIASDKGVEFVIDTAEGVPGTITTDALRLQQVLRNLISNAFKFTEQGAVTLAVSRPGKDVDLSSSGLDHDKTLAFAVSDTGIGIPKDKQAVIFEAFQQADGTTSRKYGGTGLGLSISRELARLLGGEMKLESYEGKGSTFTLYLPEVFTAAPKELDEEAAKLQARAERARERFIKKAAAQKSGEQAPETSKAPTAPAAKTQPAPQEQAPEPEAPAAEAPPAREPKLPAALESTDQIPDDRKLVKKGDKSLLIIEDDPNFARILVDMAHDRGFKCLVAGDGETGLHFADYYRPSAVVLDIGLPGMDGWAVMDRLKSNPELRHIPVHFMSAADETLDALRMGAVGYLTKPVSLESVNNALGRIESVLSKPVKRLLVVEDDELQRDSIRELIGNGDVETIAVETGEEAYEMLETEAFDCMILDLGLKDMSGFELLRRIRSNGVSGKVPIIVYTGRELNRDEEEELQRHAESIIIKGARSPERLLDETTLFLHRVEANLPEDKQRMLRMVHDKEGMLDGKKILLVDDDMRNVFALSSALEARGLEVAIARNGREGVEKLSANPDTDLVLMDIMMPEMDGYEATRTIRKRKRFRELPIIALTAKAMKGDRNKCIEAGASDYMAKPVDTDKLFSLLRVWLYR